MPNRTLQRVHWELGVTAVLFMATLQLVARLVSYVFLFHEGILLLSAVLLGGGFCVLLYSLASDAKQARVAQYLAPMIVALFFVYLPVYFFSSVFLLHFIVLSLLFGAFFVQITRYLRLAANHFIGLELLGSLLGAALIVLSARYVLEEWQIIGLSVTLLGYCVWQLWGTARQWWVISGLLLPAIVLVLVLSQSNLSRLVQCQTYKAFCIDDIGGASPLESIPNLKGRSEVYLHGTERPRQFTVRNTGVHAGTTQHQDDLAVYQYSYFDTEIPDLDYATSSQVITMGASSGSNIRSWQKYIPEADITAVEIDRTIETLYQRPAYQPYLPEPDSFSFLYGDARTTLATSQETYDVIGVIVEAVNSDLGVYVDESTSLVYTTEALASYYEHLAPGGYLILQQYAAAGAAGEAMTNKMLASLEAALPASADMAEELILYSNGFSIHPDAQRFMIAVYRPGGFSTADATQFTSWLTAMQQFSYRGVSNPFNVTLHHAPFSDDVYTAYFDETERTSLAAAFNTRRVTDERPFRHQVMPRPFPNTYYAFFLLAAGLLFALVPRLRRRLPDCSVAQFAAAFALGLVTFGLQYVLFYKTAAVINTNLIFFAVFLLIPLAFGTIGGYLSTQLSRGWLLTSAGVFAILSMGLAVLDTFTLPAAAVLASIAVLFVVAGFLFPLLLDGVADARTRTALYGINVVAGGFATILVVTVHARLGWTPLFAVLVIAVLLALGVFSTRRSGLL